jgi:hypothetical protein
VAFKENSSRRFSGAKVYFHFAAILFAAARRVVKPSAKYFLRPAKKFVP